MQLFVANNFGVLSFNGNEWKNYEVVNGKKVRSLAFDESTNRLYVGSQGDMGFFDSNWNYHTLLPLIPSGNNNFDEVWDVYLTNSRVYFCTFQGIYSYDGENIEVIMNKDNFNHSFLVNNTLYTQNAQGKLIELKNDQLIETNDQLNQNKTIAGVVKHNMGKLLFYNSGDIEWLGIKESEPDLTSLSEQLKGSYVNHILALADSRLVIATQTAGLFIYQLETGKIEQINQSKGLLGNACLRTFQDFYGNLWVGMQNGLSLIHINSPMRTINQEIDLKGSGYDSFETENGSYYTTSNGIYYSEKNSRVRNIIEGTEGPAYSIQEIAGKLYAGHHTGAFLLNNGQAKNIARTNGLWQFRQLQNNKKHVIAGTYSGLFLFKLNENNELEPVKKITGFDESSRFLEEDFLGRIWVGQFYKGLYIVNFDENFEFTKVEKATDLYDLPNDEQVIINKIDGTIYISTTSGVYTYDENKREIVRSSLFSEVIDGNPIYLFTQDKDENIHLITSEKVGYFKKISKNNYVFVPSSLYKLRYQLNNDLLNISTNVKDGVLFSANEGFIRYLPNLEATVTVEMPLLVNSIYSIDKDSLLFQKPPYIGNSENTKRLIISQRLKNIRIKMESFQYNEMNTLKYRYMLKNFDSMYSNWETSPVKDYTNLPGGKYEFLAQSLNSKGEIITSAPMKITIRPPFYKSKLAKVLYALLLLLLFYSALKWQQKRYKKRELEQEQNKQKELNRKQEEFQKQQSSSEQKISELKEEKLETEIVHMNSLLAASTMNLVVKNEFIETIKEQLKEIPKNESLSSTKKSIQSIVREINSNLRLQEDWEKFEFHFDQVHGNFLDRLREDYSDLTPQDQKLCAYLRLNLNTKEIAQLMSISVRGVEVARYRLRKRLDMDTSENLSKFILEY